MKIFVKAARPLIVGMLAAWLCSLPSVAASKNAGGANQSIPVVSYVANNPAGSTAYDIQGDGSNATSSASNANLSAYFNNVDSVTSILNANTFNSMPVGDWQLTTLSSTVRTVRIDLTGQGLNGAVAPSCVGGAMPARLIEDCTKAFKDITQMVYPSTITCPAWFRFNTSNTSLYYALNLNQSSDPTTTDVSITCLSNGRNGSCNYWTVDPIGGVPAIAQLQQISTAKGHTTTTLLGDFNLTFHFEIDETQSNPPL
jgi:hypothetical protein